MENRRALTMSFAEFCADAAGGISQEYGYRYLRLHKDDLPPVLRLPGHGRKIFFRRADVDNWLAALANAQSTKRRRGRPTKASQALARKVSAVNTLGPGSVESAKPPMTNQQDSSK